MLSNRRSKLPRPFPEPFRLPESTSATISGSVNPLPILKPHNYSVRSAPLAWILCTFFFLAGLAFIPLLGIESDEALFSQGLYQPRSELFWTHIGKTRVPIMLM